MACVTFRDVRHLLGAEEERRYRLLLDRARCGSPAFAKALAAFCREMVDLYEDDVLGEHAWLEEVYA